MNRILIQWFDLVLEHAWAYGSAGHALAGKITFQALTAGGGPADYRQGGLKLFTFGVVMMLFLVALELLGIHPYEACKIRRLFRKKDKEIMPELYRIQRQGEDTYISM
jgi:putative NADPH-quinone reductase